MEVYSVKVVSCRFACVGIGLLIGDECFGSIKRYRGH